MKSGKAMKKIEYVRVIYFALTLILSVPSLISAAEFQPISIIMEEYPYPYPVQPLQLTIEGQGLNMAHMDCIRWEWTAARRFCSFTARTSSVPPGKRLSRSLRETDTMLMFLTRSVSGNLQSPIYITASTCWLQTRKSCSIRWG